MGAAATGGVRARRSRPRAYLALARISNLPTIWTNVLAGMMLAANALSWSTFAAVAAAISLLYTGGMFLNDAFDHRFDAAHRPDRPIPAGEATLAEASIIGVVLVAGGVLLTAIAGGARAAAWAGALSLCVVYYDWRHKQDPLGPLVMGACRGLVYVVAAVSVAYATVPVTTWAAVMTLYVTAVTVLAKYGGERWGWSIAWLIAAISIVDAIAIWTQGLPTLAVLALAGFPLTLVAQRWVRGT